MDTDGAAKLNSKCLSVFKTSKSLAILLEYNSNGAYLAAGYIT